MGTWAEECGESQPERRYPRNQRSLLGLLSFSLEPPHFSGSLVCFHLDTGNDIIVHCGTTPVLLCWTILTTQRPQAPVQQPALLKRRAMLPRIVLGSSLLYSSVSLGLHYREEESSPHPRRVDAPAAPDFHELVRFAELANLCGKTQEFLDNFVQDRRDWVRGPLVVREMPEIGQRYIILPTTNPGTHTAEVTVIVRGTKTAQNLGTILQCWQTADPHLRGIPFHFGFKQMADAVYEDLQQQLRRLQEDEGMGPMKVNFTGHSMGGAVSLILAMKMRERANPEFDVGKVHGICPSAIPCPYLIT